MSSRIGLFLAQFAGALLCSYFLPSSEFCLGGSVFILALSFCWLLTQKMYGTHEGWPVIGALFGFFRTILILAFWIDMMANWQALETSHQYGFWWFLLLMVQMMFALHLLRNTNFFRKRGAYFHLDTIPGLQMEIDARLNFGEITCEEAQKVNVMVGAILRQVYAFNFLILGVAGDLFLLLLFWLISAFGALHSETLMGGCSSVAFPVLCVQSWLLLFVIGLMESLNECFFVIESLLHHHSSKGRG